jgi:dynein heavy chain
MKHICRISRIISNPGGHALLVGVGGSGKQSLSKLAAHLCGMSTYMIVISGNYGINALKVRRCRLSVSKPELKARLVYM